MLEIQDLEYSYPTGQSALRGLGFTLERGERVALLGPNGAGKSTLLLQLTGTVSGKGAIRLNGKSAQVSSLRECVGLVFQNPDDQLFCPTVAEDVAYGLRCRGLAGEELTGRVESALQAVCMSSARDRFPQNLSGGEKKRVALATVLAIGPELLVLDEPVAGLDARARRSVIDVLKSLKTALLVATHDLALASEVAERALVLDEGKLVYDGSLQSILEDEEFLFEHGLKA